MSEWREVRLGSVVEDVTVGHVGSMASEYQTDGVYFLRSQNVRPHMIDLQDVRYVSPEFHQKLAKSRLRSGDVVTVRTGTPGTSAVVPHTLGEANCSDLVITRPGPNVDSRWLSYFLNSIADTRVSSLLVGAVQQHFNVRAVRNLTVAMPDLSEQQAIADVLGALDDKIEANRKLAATADALARSIFASSIQEKGRYVALGEVAVNRPGKYLAKSDYAPEGRIPVYGSNSLMGFHDEVLVEGPFAVLARIGSFCGAIRWSHTDGWVNNNASAIVPASQVPPYVLRYAIERIDMTPFRAGSGQPFIRVKDLFQSEVLLPQLGSTERIAPALRTLGLRAFSGSEEVNALASLRDALLPKLMSGQLRVEEAVERAGL